jgi:acyl-CoA reductase-like NAD-dependent aldehyde dehydrogenase
MTVLKASGTATARETAVPRSASAGWNLIGGRWVAGDGSRTREFRARVQAGMLGINLGVPAPMAFFSFGGWKHSLFGDLHAHGPDAVAFYTRKKVVTERWFGAEAPKDGWV